MRKDILIFEKPGPANSRETVEAAVRRADELGVKHLAVASTTGQSALLLKEAAGDRDLHLVCVSYHAGFHGDDKAMPLEQRQALTEAGIDLVIASHALSGVERSIKNTFGTIGPVELMAYAFRLFGQGVKVAIEVAVMAADAGQVPTAEDIICLGGSGTGCDVAIVVRAAHQNNFFDLRVREIIAMVRG
jgi:uncharacterized protein